MSGIDVSDEEIKGRSRRHHSTHVPKHNVNSTASVFLCCVFGPSINMCFRDCVGGDGAVRKRTRINESPRKVSN